MTDAVPNMPDDVAGVRAGEELPIDRLVAYLRQALPGFDGPLQVFQFPHGHSNLTYLLQCDGQQWVLRRPPFGQLVKSAHDMGREYRVLSSLSKVFPAAPRPLVMCDDLDVLGAPFYIMELRRGLIIRRQWPQCLDADPRLLRRMCESLIDQLAALHGVDLRVAGLDNFGKPEGYVERQIVGWTKRYRDAEIDCVPAMDAVAAWLGRRIPSQRGVAFIHNDFKFDNIAFDPTCPDRIVAIFDWEMATVGDPLMDLGTTLGYWAEAGEEELLGDSIVGPTCSPGALTRQELVARYAQQTGLNCSDWEYYYIYGLFKIAVIVQQIYVRYHRGFTQDARFAQLPQQVTRLAQRAEQCIG